MMNKRLLLSSLVCVTLAAPLNAMAQAEPFRIGLILPMTGPFASTGHQIDSAVKLYMAQNGTTVAGRKVEVILKDDAGVPDQTKRLAQDLAPRDAPRKKRRRSSPTFRSTR